MSRRNVLSRNKVLRPIAAAVLAAALMGACAGPTVRRLDTADVASRPPDWPIPTTEADYREPYRVVAEITSSPYDEATVDVAGLDEMRRLARRLGGDAIVRLRREAVVRERFGYQPTKLSRLGTRFENMVVLKGVVVRFLPNPTP